MQNFMLFISISFIFLGFTLCMVLSATDVLSKFERWLKNYLTKKQKTVPQQHKPVISVCNGLINPLLTIAVRGSLPFKDLNSDDQKMIIDQFTSGQENFFKFHLENDASNVYRSLPNDFKNMWVSLTNAGEKYLAKELA